jgi:hypothetical protein
MDPQQLEDVSNGIKALHRSIKNVCEIVFAISPLLALSPRGWGGKTSVNSAYLLRVSHVLVSFSWLLTMKKIFSDLGNTRPEILVRLEDYVLECIISISEGNSREEAMQILYSQISSSMESLRSDKIAMSWFDLSSGFHTDSTSPIFQYPATPSTREFIKFHVSLCLTSLKMSSIFSTTLSEQEGWPLLQILGIIPPSSLLGHPLTYKGETYHHHDASTRGEFRALMNFLSLTSNIRKRIILPSRR